MYKNNIYNAINMSDLTMNSNIRPFVQKYFACNKCFWKVIKSE